MADSGAGDAIGSIIENWSNIGNLFLAFIVAGLVPLMRFINQKYQMWNKRKTAEQEAKDKKIVIDIVNEVNKPLNDKVEHIEGMVEKNAEQNESILDKMDLIEALLTGNVPHKEEPNNKDRSDNQQQKDRSMRRHQGSSSTGKRFDKQNKS